MENLKVHIDRVSEPRDLGADPGAEFDAEFATPQEPDPFLTELLGRVSSLMDHQLMDLAEDLLERFLQMDPKPQSLFEVAQLFYLKNQDSLALQYYTDAVSRLDEDAPFLFELYKNMGNIFVRRGDWESAEENYNRAYTINPNSSPLFVNYGTLEIQRGDLERAKTRFRQAVQLDEGNPRAWLGLALVHREFSDLELSQANLKRALDVDPVNPVALDLAQQWGLS